MWGFGRREGRRSLAQVQRAAWRPRTCDATDVVERRVGGRRGCRLDGDGCDRGVVQRLESTSDLREGLMFRLEALDHAQASEVTVVVFGTRAGGADCGKKPLREVVADRSRRDAGQIRKVGQCVESGVRVRRRHWRSLDSYTSYCQELRFEPSRETTAARPAWRRPLDHRSRPQRPQPADVQETSRRRSARGRRRVDRTLWRSRGP